MSNFPILSLPQNTKYHSPPSHSAQPPFYPFGSCRLGNSTFGKMPLGKMPFGKQKETSLQLLGILNIKNRQYKFHSVVFEVSSRVNNPVQTEIELKTLLTCVYCHLLYFYYHVYYVYCVSPVFMEYKTDNYIFSNNPQY